MLNQQEERKKFEARVLLRKPDASFVMKKGRYVDRSIQFRWAGWLDKAHDGVPPPPVRDEKSTIRPWCNTWRAQNGYPLIKEDEGCYKPVGAGEAPKRSILKPLVKLVSCVVLVVGSTVTIAHILLWSVPK